MGAETIGPWTVDDLAFVLLKRWTAWGLECVFSNALQVRYKAVLLRPCSTVTWYRTTLNVHVQANTSALRDMRIAWHARQSARACWPNPRAAHSGAEGT